MPYVDMKCRESLDIIVNLMKNIGIKADGDLNYVLFKFCKENINTSYNDIKNFIGEMRQCISEIERRILAPYEDKKIEENGDV